MTLSTLNSLTIIILFGALVLLSFLLFVNPLKANRKANLCLAATFLLWATFWLEEVFALAEVYELNVYVIFLLRFLQFLTPFFFYLAVVYFTNPNYKLQQKPIKHIVFPILYLVILSLHFFSSKSEQPIIKILLIGLIFIQAVFYVAISFFKIRKHQKKVLLFSSDTYEIDLSWLEYIIISMLFIVVIILFYNVLLDFATPNFFMNLTFLVVVFMIAFFSLKQKEIYPIDKKQRTELIAIDEEVEHSETKRKLIPDEDLETIKKQLTDLMLNEKPYLDSELNLIKLSDLLKITPHQLSYAINTGFNENFFEFVNKYRVEKAKELLATENKHNLTILAIAFESGFNSKTSFNTTFKKITNLTPSEFKKRGSNL